MSRTASGPGVPGAAPRTTRMAVLLFASIGVGFAILLVRTAWQCDDAFITYRTVENLFGGHGLVWNPGERVQSYTHPLWMMGAVLTRGVTGELYFSMLGISLVCVLGALALVVVLGRASLLAALPLLALSTSAAAVDFGTSGLENPLLALLLLVFLLVSGRSSRYRPLLVALTAAGVMLTRIDAVLVIGPLLAWTAWHGRARRQTWVLLAIGLSPVLIWEGFSLVYYGSLVPNSAYAKLNLEIPAWDLARQGLTYLLDSLLHDPISLLLILVAVALAAARGTPRERCFATGLVLYLLYVVRIGGDFMSGRFVASLAYAAAGLLALRWAGTPVRSDVLGRGGLALAVVVLVVYGALFPASRWRSGANFGEGRVDIVRASGIADERAYYYPSTGLLPVLRQWPTIRERGLPVPPYSGALEAREFRHAGGGDLVVAQEVGFLGYFIGPETYVVDAWALSDPLLSRIPFVPDGRWRIGHYPRPLPGGYLASLSSGQNRLADPEIAVLYEDLQTVTRGRLLSRERFHAIVRLHTRSLAATPPTRE